MKFLTSLFVLCVLALAAPAAWFEPLCPCPSDCRCLAGSCRCGPAAAQDWCCEGCDCKGSRAYASKSAGTRGTTGTALLRGPSPARTRPRRSRPWK
jgi:hypothetical protein